MSIFALKGRFWRSSPFTEEVTEIGPIPTRYTRLTEVCPILTRYTRLTYENGEEILYSVEDDIGPHPNIFEGFIEVGEGRFVSTKGVAKIETWREKL